MRDRRGKGVDLRKREITEKSSMGRCPKNMTVRVRRSIVPIQSETAAIDAKLILNQNLLNVTVPDSLH